MERIKSTRDEIGDDATTSLLEPHHSLHSIDMNVKTASTATLEVNVTILETPNHAKALGFKQMFGVRLSSISMPVSLPNY